MSQQSPQCSKRNWKELVEQQKKSSLTVRQWCQNNDIPITTFYGWKRRLVSIPPLQRESFAELPSVDACFVIEMGRCRVSMSHADMEMLKQCLQVMKSLRC